MSKRRDDQGKFSKKPSKKLLISSWVGSLLSIGLVYAAGSAVLSVLGSFRSCSANNGLVVVTCGKRSINLMDSILILLFIACVCLTITLFTAAWRYTRRTI